jgi:hypothetical protein
LKQFRVVAAKTFSFTTSQTAAGKMLIALGQVKLESFPRHASIICA